MKDIPKLDIFDRKNRSQIKIGEYRSPYKIENSKNNYSEENGFPDFLTTQMHVFAEELFPMIDDGLKKLEKYKKSLRYK